MLINSDHGQIDEEFPWLLVECGLKTRFNAAKKTLPLSEWHKILQATFASTTTLGKSLTYVKDAIP